MKTTADAATQNAMRVRPSSRRWNVSGPGACFLDNSGSSAAATDMAKRLIGSM
jgi:hypothetical protein